MKRFKILFCLCACFLFTCPALLAQAQPEMADTMRSNGKIYVVVAVCLLILVGLFGYVLSLERRIRKMEKGT